MKTKHLIKLYNSLFETWRFEVNSHWQRSSYFAAFETVAVGACWKVLQDAYVVTAIIFSMMGLLLTTIWLFNNKKTHYYAIYWLKKVAWVERKLVERTGEQVDFAAQILSRPRGNLVRHRRLVQAVPIIFYVIWLGLFAIAIAKELAMKPVIRMNAIGYSAMSIFIALTSLLVSIAATYFARGSFLQSKMIADRDRRDWKQRKWFDLYAKGDEVFDALTYFRTQYDGPTSASWGNKDWSADWNHLIREIKRLHRWAVVFPRTPPIDALIAATGNLGEPAYAVTQEAIDNLFNAVEGVRQQALITDPKILS